MPAVTGKRDAASARACALAVVRRVFEHGAYADRAFTAESAALGPRDRAFAMQLAYGTVQRRATLDHLARELLTRPLEKLDPPVLAALRIGLFQLIYMGGVADHAAVGESVELIKRVSPGGAGLVNAVLRRAAAEGTRLVEGLRDATPGEAAVMHSVPVWLAELWWRELGAEAARGLLAWINRPAESALRVNTLVSDVETAVAALPVPSHPAPSIPEGRVLDAAFDVHGSALWRAGAVMPQSRGSMLVGRVVEPSPGQRVLDLCAAPGGKATHLAALMGGSGSVLAVERHPGRAKALARTSARMQADCVQVDVGDAAVPRSDGPFDRILVDPPCSGLGTLQSRPDLRWRVTPESIRELVALQGRILAAGAAATAPGGALVYSVCTISAAEGVEVIGRFERDHPEFAVEDLGSAFPGWSHPGDGRFLQLLPHRDGTDGFFLARLVRAEAAPRRGATAGAARGAPGGGPRARLT